MIFQKMNVVTGFLTTFYFKTEQKYVIFAILQHGILLMRVCVFAKGLAKTFKSRQTLQLCSLAWEIVFLHFGVQILWLSQRACKFPQPPSSLSSLSFPLSPLLSPSLMSYLALSGQLCCYGNMHLVKRFAWSHCYNTEAKNYSASSS